MVRPAHAVLALLAIANAAWAQPSTDRLTIVAPAAPGGGWDQTARALQHVLEAEGIVRVVEVQNVPGAAGTIGLSQFINAERGNNRALLISGLVMLGATLWNESPVSMSRVTPIARLTGEYEVIAVPSSSPHADLQSLVRTFREHPEALAWGGGSAGGTDHILTALVAEAAGVDPRRVNYIAFSGGGEAVAALLGGHVAAGVSGYSEFAPHIASGRLRALAVSSPSRISGIAVPTLRETGIDVELVNWRAVMAPAGISGDDRVRLTSLVGRATRTERWRQMLAEREWTDLYLDGDAFDADLQAERARFTRIVARLRGRAPTAVGQHIVPIAVVGGGLLVLIALVVNRLRSSPDQRGSKAPLSNPDGPALLLVCAGLAAFAALLPIAGFILAGAALFSMTALAFRRAPAAATRFSRRDAVRLATIAVVFCTIVYLAFTRGLDLPLPAGSLWTWMH